MGFFKRENNKENRESVAGKEISEAVNKAVDERIDELQKEGINFIVLFPREDTFDGMIVAKDLEIARGFTKHDTRAKYYNLYSIEARKFFEEELKRRGSYDKFL